TGFGFFVEALLLIKKILSKCSADKLLNLSNVLSFRPERKEALSEKDVSELLPVLHVVFIR
ncbi:hypothetical protein, partial [Vibrio campbellii]|uniref:hypothetical protein n=1 Tax=Vibrio campbellii TaxID=680 RepID=UPI001E3EE4AC